MTPEQTAALDGIMGPAHALDVAIDAVLARLDAGAQQLDAGEAMELATAASDAYAAIVALVGALDPKRVAASMRRSAADRRAHLALAAEADPADEGLRRMLSAAGVPPHKAAAALARRRAQRARQGA